MKCLYASIMLMRTNNLPQKTLDIRLFINFIVILYPYNQEIAEVKKTRAWAVFLFLLIMCKGVLLKQIWF